MFLKPCRGGILTRIPQPKAVRRADARAGVSSGEAEDVIFEVEGP